MYLLLSLKRRDGRLKTSIRITIVKSVILITLVNHIYHHILIYLRRLRGPGLFTVTDFKNFFECIKLT